jgi:diphosphomevalonate decarboxylase
MTPTPSPANSRPAAPGVTQALAHPNIALIKYWGKRDEALNLPAVGSLSVTLDTLTTETRIHLDPALPADAVFLNGEPAPAKEAARAGRFLDLLRRRVGGAPFARIDSHNNFPTGAGLASSASGFAALVTAAGHALGLALSDEERSILARQGSGSAARSIFGGFVEMARGSRADGDDARARPLLAAQEWPFGVVIAITDTRVKAVGSTEGMQRTALTSPYYQAWVDTGEVDLAEARGAIERRDFEALASVSEYSCLKMHALALAARPGLLYWNAATVECLHLIRRLRADGVPVFFTVDAGPQIKALCPPEARARVARSLAEVPGVLRVVETGLGEGARVVETVASA